MTDEQIAEFDRRVAEIKADPAGSLSHEEVSLRKAAADAVPILLLSEEELWRRVDSE